jgi:hypothetical protein
MAGGGYVDIGVVSPGLFVDHSHRLATLQHPMGVTNDDGVMIVWNGNHHVCRNAALAAKLCAVTRGRSNLLSAA